MAIQMKEILNASTAHTGQRQWRERCHCGERGDGRGSAYRLRHLQAGLLRPGRGGRVQFGEAAAVVITHDHGDHTKGLGVVLRGLAKAGAHPAVCASEAVFRGLRASARGCGQRRRRVRALRRRRSARFGRPGRASPSALPTMRPIPTGFGSKSVEAVATPSAT